MLYVGVSGVKCIPRLPDSPKNRAENRRPSHYQLARISHHLTVEARNRPAIITLRLLAVLNVGFKYARIIQETGRQASRAFS